MLTVKSAKAIDIQVNRSRKFNSDRSRKEKSMRV